MLQLTLILHLQKVKNIGNFLVLPFQGLNICIYIYFIFIYLIIILVIATYSISPDRVVFTRIVVACFRICALDSIR